MRARSLMWAVASALVSWSIPALAQTPPCGTIVTTPGTTITFDADMVCPEGFAGRALTIQADNVSVVGGGFRIQAPGASEAIYVSGSSGVSLQNLDLGGSGAIGIYGSHVTGLTVRDINVSGSGGSGMFFQQTEALVVAGSRGHGRYAGIYFHYNNSNNRIEGNDFSSNEFGILDYGCCSRSGNTFIDNDVSKSTQWGITLHAEAAVTIARNHYANSTNALRITGVDGLIIDGEDFSSETIASRVLSIRGMTNSVIRNVDLSGTAATRDVWGTSGLGLEDSSGNLIENIVVHNRYTGINLSYGAEANTFRGNDLSGNRTAIYSWYPGNPRAGNQYLGNRVSDSLIGIAIYNEAGTVLADNDFSHCEYALQLSLMDSVLIDGMDFASPTVSKVVISLNGVTNSILRNLDLSGDSAVEPGWGVAGITMGASTGNLIENVIVRDRYWGISLGQDAFGNEIRGSDLSGNTFGIYSTQNGTHKSGNRYVQNQVSTSTYGIYVSNEWGFELAGNDFSSCAYALRILSADGVTIDGTDFSSATVSRVVVGLYGVTNSVLRNLDLSGAPGVEPVWGMAGITLENSTGNLIENVTVHDRYWGISLGQGAAGNEIRGNDLSGNTFGINSGQNGVHKTGNRYIANQVSNCDYGVYLNNEWEFELIDNDFSNCLYALRVVLADGVTIDGVDFSSPTISNTVLGLYRVTNSTIRNVVLSGTPETKAKWGTSGIWLEGSSDNLIEGVTVHDRYWGIAVNAGSHRNTVRGNDLSGNTNGISSGSSSDIREGNAYLANDLSNCTRGISLGQERGALIRDNRCTSSWLCLDLSTAESVVASGNVLSSTASTAFLATRQEGLEIWGNSITGAAADGVKLSLSSVVRFQHNNIHGNAGWQLTSDQPIELSYGNEGNYWGRHCGEEPFVGLFVAGQDSNALDVVDSFAYGTENGWLSEVDPGCGPPPPGDVLAEVRDLVGPVGGVTVLFYDSGHSLIDQTVTAGDGTIRFEDVEPGVYFVSMLVPIGYAATTPTELEAIVDSEQETAVDFELERLVVAVDTRGMGFWKHQAKSNVTGKGSVEVGGAALLGYLADIERQYDVFDAVTGLEGLLGVLDPPKPSTMRERAEQHLMTLLLNLSSLRIATYSLVSDDDTAGEAIDYAIEVLGNPGSAAEALESVKGVVEAINDGLIPLERDRVPEPFE